MNSLFVWSLNYWQTSGQIIIKYKFNRAFSIFILAYPLISLSLSYILYILFILDFYKIFCISLLGISELEDRKVKLIFILLRARPITTNNDYISSYEVQNGLFFYYFLFLIIFW